jgi:hypothetical protein
MRVAHILSVFAAWLTIPTMFVFSGWLHLYTREETRAVAFLAGLFSAWLTSLLFRISEMLEAKIWEKRHEHRDHLE